MRSKRHEQNLLTCIPPSPARRTGSRAVGRRGRALLALSFTAVLLVSPRPAGGQSSEKESPQAGPIVTDRPTVTYNVGTSVVTSTINCESESNVDLNYAVALNGSTGGPFSFFAELYGALVSGSDRQDRHSFQAGTTILLSRMFQIDFRGGAGLSDDEPDWFVGAGLAFQVPH